MRNYIGRFNVEAVSISNIQQEAVVILILMMGLKEGTFFIS